MELFPTFLRLNGRRVLVVGGGPVAASKRAALLAADAAVTVVSPEVSRWAANLLTEWPVLLALLAGITDTTTLSRLYSLGLFYPSAATLALSWWVVRLTGWGAVE